MKSTQDKRALVTGGNRGIGFAIAPGSLAKDYKIIADAAIWLATDAPRNISGKFLRDGLRPTGGDRKVISF